MATDYEAVIGLEIHAQLLTASKAFSSAPANLEAEPNTLVNEVCSGQPGSLPVLNERAVEFAVRAGIAFDCDIQTRSVFARKNYFYPDLPKGYQISQYDEPLCLNGSVHFELDGEARSVALERIHMEEDTGKSQHEGDRPESLIDLNRAGTPLIEIVSRPDMRSADEASAFFKELRAVLVAAGINDGNLQSGSMRCDANVSVRPRGQQELGTKVEVKNLNSFKYLRDAIEFEIQRQIDEIEGGGVIYQETRTWNEAKRETLLLRRKEGSADYRYFPEPDLPPLVVTPDRQAEIGAAMDAEMAAAGRSFPRDLRTRLRDEVGLHDEQMSFVTGSHPDMANYFDAAFAPGTDFAGKAKAMGPGVVNLLSGALGPALNDGSADIETRDGRPVAVLQVKQKKKVSEVTLPATHFAALQGLIDAKTISKNIAKTVVEHMLATGDAPKTIVDREGLQAQNDEGAIAALVDGVIDKHPDEAARYRGGKVQLLGFFVGQVMKASRGRADAGTVRQLLAEKLGPVEES